MIDEGQYTGGDKTYFKDGTIRLQNSENVGIDVQGTHGGSKEKYLHNVSV